MLNLILYVVLRLASWLLGIVPASTMYRLASGAGWCAFYLVRDARDGITDNLAVVLGQDRSSPEVRKVARRAFQHDAMNWVDTLRIGHCTLAQVREIVQMDDWTWLQGATHSGHGAILVTLHIGNFDLVGQVLAAHGYRLTVPVERMQPQALFDFLMRERTSNGITLVPVEHAARELIRALRAGELVGLAGDRAMAGKTAQVPVFGRSAALPLGPVSLARRTGAPLIFAVGIRERPGVFRGIARPVSVSDTGDAAADDARNLANFVRLMEEIVSEYPEQWLAFRPFWSVNAGHDTAATMGHQKRAAV